MSFTVLTAEFSHETNTFSIRPTDYRAFAERYCFVGDRAVAERGNGNTDLAGFMDIASARGWRTLHALSTSAPPAGPVTRDAFDRLAGAIVAMAREHCGCLDGILLGLHGAMVPDFCQDGEGELLERLRAVVGRDLLIAITLDPHANVTARMCALADIVVSYKTYPHVDMRDCGHQAAAILHRAMSGEIRPVTLRAHRPMLEEVSGGRTDIGPMVERIARARAYEEESGVYAVSINGGFGNADIEEVGPSVLVTAEGDLARHRAFAEVLMDDIWDRRFENVSRFVSVDKAASPAQGFESQSGPLVIADYADNPGSGAYGDATALLGALLEAGVNDACVGPMIDPKAAGELHRAKVGETVSLRLGGKTDPHFGGPPLELTGTLLHLSQGGYIGDGPMQAGLKGCWGPTAVLRVDGIDVLVVSRSTQMLDLQQFRAFGIDSAAKRVCALKSMQHFRAAFEPIASEVILCDSEALCSPDLAKLPYVRVRRQIFPLDLDMTLAD